MDLGGSVFKGEPGLEGGNFGLEVGDEGEEGGGGAGNVTEATAVFRAIGVVSRGSVGTGGRYISTYCSVNEKNSQPMSAPGTFDGTISGGFAAS